MINPKEESVRRKEKIILEGTITEAFPGIQFKAELDNGHTVLAYLSGKMRSNYIKVLLGDRVKLEISPYDISRGRIVYRNKKRDKIPEI